MNFIFVVGHTIQKKTARLALNVSVAAALNVVLNLLLIPRLHLAGAAVATTIAYAALVALNYSQSRSVVDFRLDAGVILKAFLAAAVMVVLVYGVGPVSSRSIVDLSVRATAGAATAALFFWLLDENLRQWTWSRLERRSG
jgi:O-antigen/teichoic acid export membrane protein